MVIREKRIAGHKRGGVWVDPHIRRIEVNDDMFADPKLLKEKLQGSGNAYVSFSSFKDKFDAVDFVPSAWNEDKSIQIWEGVNDDGEKCTKTMMNDGTLVMKTTNSDGVAQTLTEVPPIKGKTGGYRSFEKQYGNDGNEYQTFTQYNNGEKSWEYANAESDDYETWDKFPNGRVDVSEVRPDGKLYTKVDYPDGTDYTQLYQKTKAGDWKRYERMRDGKERAMRSVNGRVFEISREPNEKEWVEPTKRHAAAINFANTIGKYTRSFNFLRGSQRRTTKSKLVLDLLSDVFSLSKSANQESSKSGFGW